MGFTEYTLFILACLLPCIPLRQYSISRNGIVFNHVTAFSFGYYYYWLLPVGVYMTRAYEKESIMAQWHGLIDGAPPGSIVRYLLCCILFYGGFWIGTALCRAIFTKSNRVVNAFPMDRRLLNIPWLLGVVSGTVLTFLVRGELFRGYTSDINEDRGPRGMLVAVSIYLLSIALIDFAKRFDQSKLPVTIKDLLSSRFFISFAIISVLIMSLGSRLYLLSGIMMLLIYATVYHRPIPIGKLLVFAGVLVPIFVLVGITRIGGTAGAAGFYLFTEPIFTSLSLIGLFYSPNPFPAFNSPMWLVSNFINLVPTVIFPNKVEFLLSPKDSGYILFAPLGALHSFYSFIVNFGVAGTFLFLIAFSFFLAYLSLRANISLLRVMYVMITGWCVFSLFRDPFSVSIVKAMIQYSILVPTFIMLTLHMATVYLRHGKTTTPIDSAAPSS